MRNKNTKQITYKLRGFYDEFVILRFFHFPGREKTYGITLGLDKLSSYERLLLGIGIPFWLI